MRDNLKNRAGFDRVLMSVAATFLTVSTGSALAQDQARSSAAELAIEAAIPRPEPANVPPPTAADIKMDTTASTTDVAQPAPVTPDHAALAPAVPLGTPVPVPPATAAVAPAIAPAPAAAPATAA